VVEACPVACTDILSKMPGHARRVLVHDYAGHPFQVELSRELASRGYDVLHLHCAAYVSGKGNLERKADDPASFHSEPLMLPRFDKHSIARRVVQELRYGRMLARRISAMKPEIVVSANTPLFAQALALRAAGRVDAMFVYWQQDILSIAARQVLAERLPLGPALARPIAALEARLLRQSDVVVTISSDFCDILGGWRIPPERVAVIENWAPLRELREVERDNDWARENGFIGKRVLLYSGTLGLKHNPELLATLARRFRNEPDVSVVVVSEGSGASALAEIKAAESLDNLVILPFQPYERLPEVLATATILLAILGPEAGVFSVPSKILSYLCAGRPILASIPPANLAARTLRQSGVGTLVSPGDTEGFAEAAAQLLGDHEQVERAGRVARAYAEASFDISKIATRFESVFERGPQ
jgi:colanic acid biosynthesis glycosyl transferase WcaI